MGDRFDDKSYSEKDDSSKKSSDMSFPKGEKAKGSGFKVTEGGFYGGKKK